MPINLIVSEGVLTAEAEKVAFKNLTDLLLKLHGLSGNGFMTPNVIGEVAVIPKGRSYAGGEQSEIAIVELKVPAVVLPTKELKDAWVSQGTAIIEDAAQGRLPRHRIFFNVTYAVEGTWGIAGEAFDHPALGAAIAAG
jgi:hypothetical protein